MPGVFSGGGLQPASVASDFYIPQAGSEEWNRNLFTFTEQFENAAWTTGAASFSANRALAPDGSMTGDKWIESAATSNHEFQRFLTGIRNTIYTVSIHAKAAERSFLRFRIYDDSTDDHSGRYFDLSDGSDHGADTAGSTFGTSFSISSAGNGWYRLSATMGHPGNRLGFICGVNNPLFTDNYAGDGASGFYVWGAQIEKGQLSEYKAVPSKTQLASAPRSYGTRQAVNRAATF